MNKKIVKCAILSCVFGVFFTILGLSLNIKADENSTSIVIYHTNDMHGNVNSVFNDEKLSRIGLDIVKSAKDNTPNSILIDVGDAIWGTQFAKQNKGLDVINLMNAVGYDGMTLGNHEFDYGIDSLLDCVKLAKFPVISANTYRNGDIFLKDINGCNGRSFIIEKVGKKIGFVGIITEETSRITIPPNLNGIEFKDEIETTRTEVKKLKEQGVDIVVVISHIGVDIASKITSKDLAKRVPGIDIIIDGHSHTEFIGEENGTIITQTGIGLANLGKIDIKFTKTKPQITASLICANDIGHMFHPDNAITKMYDSIYSKISFSLENIVGKIQNNLYGGTYNGINISRLIETNMGDFICDAMLDRGKKILKDTEFKDLPIVAFENGGAVRSTINSGYIQMDDIYNIFPLDNRLSFQIITPSILYQILERGVSKLVVPKFSQDVFIGSFGGFPQISGIKVEVDPYLEPFDYNKNISGNRISKVNLINSDGSDGIPLSRDDNETKVMFLFNDYALYEFPSIKNVEIVMKDDYLYNIVAEYMSNLTYQNNGCFSYPYFNNRITIKQTIFQNMKYDAELTLKDKTGELSMVSVSVSVDGKDIGNYTSDENSKIFIKGLDSGAHIIKIKHGIFIKEVYVNNEIGMKSNIVDFIDNFDKDIISVSNIIGQIPYNIDLECNKIVKFARTSYDNLSEEQKSKILNYSKLQNAEDRIKIIQGSENSDNLIPKLDKSNTLVMFVALLVFISGLAIIFIFRKNKIKR